MKKKLWRAGSLFLLVLMLSGCGGMTADKSAAGTAAAVKTAAAYQKITPDEARLIMENETNYIILDVRTEEEYKSGHIPGALLIPDYEISEKAEAYLKDKDQQILVYCRSGNRSKTAAQNLVKMGYTNVKDFGGIRDWPYETE